MRVMVCRWCRLGMVVASLTSIVLAPAAPMWAGEVGSIQLLRALVVQAEPTGRTGDGDALVSWQSRRAPFDLDRIPQVAGVV